MKEIFDVAILFIADFPGFFFQLGRPQMDATPFSDNFQIRLYYLLLSPAFCTIRNNRVNTTCNLSVQT